jgi:hypothetical protein
VEEVLVKGSWECILQGWENLREKAPQKLGRGTIPKKGRIKPS